MGNHFSSDQHITTTNEFFAACLDQLGMTTMVTVCRRKQAQIYKYAQDTAHHDQSYQNPADLILDLFERMEKLNRRSVAVDLMRFMADRIGLEVSERDPAKPDRETIFEEICDDHDTLNAFYSALKQEPKPRKIPLVMILANECIREINENTEKYKELCNAKEEDRQG